MENNKTDAEIQRENDRAEIKVKLLENGVLVKSGQGWFTFEDWPKASEHIGARLDKLKRERAKS